MRPRAPHDSDDRVGADDRNTVADRVTGLTSGNRTSVHGRASTNRTPRRVSSHKCRSESPRRRQIRSSTRRRGRPPAGSDPRCSQVVYGIVGEVRSGLESQHEHRDHRPGRQHDFAALVAYGLGERTPLGPFLADLGEHRALLDVQPDIESHGQQHRAEWNGIRQPHCRKGDIRRYQRRCVPRGR